MKTWLSRIFAATQGRTTAFILAFFVSGNVMAWFDKLSYVYVAFMATLLSAVIGHSVKCDIFDKSGQNGNGTTPQPSP